MLSHAGDATERPATSTEETAFSFPGASFSWTQVDAAHVPFTHHASVSKRQSSGSYADMKVTEKGPWGFRGVWETGEQATQHTKHPAPAADIVALGTSSEARLPQRAC